tara:strand:- start:86 stop:430 length:345 start_codon:yes stop_codon:yes gene_type:complete
MNKIKIIAVIIFIYILYKVITSIMDFDLAVQDKVKKIEEVAEVEKESTVIGLIMYLGDPPELQEHLFMPSSSRCLELKEIAGANSFAYYECAKVKAVVKNKKIITLIEKIEVIE